MESDKVGIDFFELVNIPLIQYTASKGKPMILSTGMGTAGEIQEALENFLFLATRYVLLHQEFSDCPKKRSQNCGCTNGKLEEKGLFLTSCILYATIFIAFYLDKVVKNLVKIEEGFRCFQFLKNLA